MLEKDYQLSAYKKLAAAGGMKTPGAITSARNSANTAKLLAEELTGLILDTIVYPDTITSYVSTIRTTTTGLTNIVEPRQPGGCKLKTAPVRPVVAARPAEYVCSEDLFY